jgi:cyanophycin synthetase
MPTPESPAEGLTAHFRQPFHGPNPYSREPVVIAALAFEPDALSKGPARCAHIAEHCGHWFTPQGSFDDCATPLGIAEFLARWSLAALNRRRGYLDVAKVVEENGEVIVALGFHHPALSRKVLQLAVTLFNNADSLDADALKRSLGLVWRECREQHPDYQVQFVMQAAREVGVPYFWAVQPRKIWQFGWGARGELFLESESSRDSTIGDRLSRDKPITKLFLHGLGVPVPLNGLAEKVDDIDAAIAAVGFPCVVKPMNGGRSVGVTTDITDRERLKAVVRQTLAEHGAPVMIEQQVPGEVYRILVARGRVACVVRRAPPQVVGDGKSTVRALIAAKNRELAEQRETMDFVGEIPLDDECAAALAREKIGLDEVPAKGRTLALRRVPLLSSGAVYTDVTGETHPDTCRMAELVAASLGIENCGIDFITADITRPMSELGAVLEANTMPGLRVPMMAGLDPLEIGRLILGDHAARVPAALLVAPAARMAAMRAAAAFGEPDGWAIGRATGVGPLALTPVAGFGVRAGEPNIHQCALLLVRNPFVERIFIAAAIEDVVATGLPLDRFDTVAVFDCKPDAAWEKVLREAAGTYVKAKDLAEALRKCGVSARAKKPTKAN